MTTRIVIAGVGGRMGQELLAAVAAAPDCALVGGVIRPGSRARHAAVLDRVQAEFPDCRIGDDLTALLPGTDVVIDFTNPGATLDHARQCAAAGVAFAGGATGFSPEHNAELDALATRIPLYMGRNTSAGIGALLAVLPLLRAALADYDIEIVETHHRHKRDAPSGTALMLAETIAGADAAFVHGREGLAPRQAGEIGIHAVRGGGNPGEHQVIFAAEGEEIRISHRAFSRRAYADGAVRAARWLVTQPAGRYGPTDLQPAAPGAMLAAV